MVLLGLSIPFPGYSCFQLCAGDTTLTQNVVWFLALGFSRECVRHLLLPLPLVSTSELRGPWQPA